MPTQVCDVQIAGQHCRVVARKKSGSAGVSDERTKRGLGRMRLLRSALTAYLTR